MDGGDAAGAYGMQYRYSPNKLTGMLTKMSPSPYGNIELEFQHEVFRTVSPVCSRGCHATVASRPLQDGGYPFG